MSRCGPGDLRLKLDQLVEQLGGIACHTGRHSCFFRRLDGDRWTETDPVLKDPDAIYRK